MTQKRIRKGEKNDFNFQRDLGTNQIIFTAAAAE
jgi:hypothetical protein